MKDGCRLRRSPQVRGLAVPLHCPWSNSPLGGTRCQVPACPFFGESRERRTGRDALWSDRVKWRAGTGVHTGIRHHLRGWEEGTQMWGRRERFAIHSHGYNIMSYLERKELLSVPAFRSVADALFLRVLVASIPTPYRLHAFPSLSMSCLCGTPSHWVLSPAGPVHKPFPPAPVKPSLCAFVPKETSLHVTDFLSCFLAAQAWNINHPLPHITEKAMATHSSTLAWKIPWTEEPGGLRSTGLLRVGHGWATSLSLVTFTHWRRKWQPTPVFLPGRIPGMGEPGGLPSMGLHRVGHDWSDLAAAAAPHKAFTTICLLSFSNFERYVLCWFLQWFWLLPSRKWLQVCGAAGAKGPRPGVLSVRKRRAPDHKRVRWPLPPRWAHVPTVQRERSLHTLLSVWESLEKQSGRTFGDGVNVL